MFKLNLVIEPDSGAVIYHAPSLIVASTLCRGLYESSPIMAIIDQRPPSINDTASVYLCEQVLSGRYVLRILPEEKIAPIVYKNINLARARGQALFELELLLHRHLDKIADADQELDAYVLHSLRLCDPSSNSYSMGINEYAEITGMTQQEAYQELQLRFESRGRTKLLHYALFQRYAAVINSLTSKEEAALKIREWWSETNGWKV